MKTVHEVSRLSGVSIRTLHHYDSIGLLKPTKVTEAGYRLYDNDAISRLHTVLMYRELGFRLSEIREITDNPDFDVKIALKQHIKMLKLQKEHIDKLISLAEKIEKDGNIMDFSAFDKSKIDEYSEEIKQKWGKTEAYKEYVKKIEGKTDYEKQSSADGLIKLLGEFGQLKKQPADSDDVQKKVGELQKYITDNFYTCTKEILKGLGQMYVCDERFRNNINNAGGEHTAEFVSKAIEIYCE